MFVHDLFEKAGFDEFHDVVAEVTKLSLSEEKLKKLFRKLPNQYQNVAFTYGLNDTVFTNYVREYLGIVKLETLI